MTEVRVFRSPSEVSQLLQDYARLDYPGSPIPLTSRPFWLQSYLAAYGASIDPIVVEAADSDGNRLLMPLRQVDSVGVAHLCASTADYVDLIWDAVDEATGELAAACLSTLKQLNLTRLALARVPPSSVTQRALQSAATLAGATSRRSDTAQMPYISVSSGAPETWPGTDLQSLLQYRRKAEKLAARAVGDIKLSRDLLPRGNLLADARRSQIEVWRKRGGQSTWADPRRDAFIHSLCARASDLGLLRVSSLYIFDEFAAVRLGFASGASIWEWLTAFSLRFKTWSPGAVLLYMTLQRCGAEWGVSDSYELLRGAESWKFLWTKLTRQAELLEVEF